MAFHRFIPVNIFQPKTVPGQYHINHRTSEIVMVHKIAEAMIAKTISLVLLMGFLYLCMAVVLRVDLVPVSIISGYFRVSTVGGYE